MNKAAWRYYLRFYRGHYGKLFLAILVSIVASMSVLPIGHLLLQAFGRVIPSRGIGLLLAFGVLTLVLSLLKGAVSL